MNTRTPGSLPRPWVVLIAIVLSPAAVLAGMLLLTLLAGLVEYWQHPSHSNFQSLLGSDPLWAFGLVLVRAAPVVWLAVVIYGLPALLLLRRLRMLSWQSISLAGAVGGAAVDVAVGHRYFHGSALWLMSALGLMTALFFWLVVGRPRSKNVKPLRLDRAV